MFVSQIMSFFRTSKCSRRVIRRAPQAVDALEPRLLLTTVSMSDEEQLLLELINRARANPLAEAGRFGIDLNASLPSGTISSTPKQPLAPNQQLINAAVAHSVDMINRDFFAHTNPSGVTPGGRATAAGYDWRTIAENIAYSGYFNSPNMTSQTLELHELLFRSAGHRTNILAEDIEEIGTGIRNGAFNPAGSNATLITEKFGRRNLNPIITGVVYSDNNDSDFYDIGEAVRAGTVTATRLSDNQVFSVTIGTSGGYGIIVPAGTYNVQAQFTAAGATRTISRQVTVSTNNVKVDFDAAEVDPLSLSLSSATVNLNESGTTSTLMITVTRTGNTASAVTVNLTSTDTSEITVPTTVQIPAGQTSAQFPVTGVADGIIDGFQVARVRAAADGAAVVERTLRIADRTAPVFASSLITSTVARPVFSWTAIANANSYEILVTDPQATQSTVLTVAGITATTFTSPIDLAISNYNVWVRGETTDGVKSVWSSVAIWRVRPTTIVLNHGTRVNSGTFPIRWNPVPGAASYDVWVDNLTPRTIQFYREQTVFGTSHTVTDFPIGRYRIFVRARNSRGDLTSWSPAALQDVSLAPEGLNVTASQLSSIPTLNWNAVPGAARYEVRVDNRTTNVPLFVNNTSVTGTSLALPTLTFGSYRAWVRAKGSNGAVYSYSVPLEFEYNSPPRFSMSITNPMPARPLLTWTTVSGASRYELIIANAALVPVIVSSNLTVPQFQPSSNLAAGTYRAWIKAFDASGNQSARSATITFTVAYHDESPDTPPETLAIDEAFELLADSTHGSWLLDESAVRMGSRDQQHVFFMQNFQPTTVPENREAASDDPGSHDRADHQGLIYSSAFAGLAGLVLGTTDVASAASDT